VINVIEHFVRSARTEEGYGFFEGDAEAVELARSMGKGQIRKYYRHGLVPGAFVRYLKRIEVIPEDTKFAADEPTIDDLLDLLWRWSYGDEKSRLAADFLRKAILVARLPMLRKAFGSADGIWQKIETG